MPVDDIHYILFDIFCVFMFVLQAGRFGDEYCYVKYAEQAFLNEWFRGNIRHSIILKLVSGLQFSKPNRKHVPSFDGWRKRKRITST